jgi:uncharacterized protein (TIGR00730 family)
MKRICVFCGSNFGLRPVYADMAQKVGAVLAAEGIELVYGGGRVGLMGTIADAVLAAGGKVIGIIPEALAAKEVAHQRLTELYVVGSMHERKAMMEELSDGFIALPGGFGTFEEYCEILTWAQLGFHQKPCGILNAAGYYDSLLSQFDSAVAEGFVSPEHRRIVLVEEEIETLLERMSNYQPPATGKWLDEESEL